MTNPKSPLYKRRGFVIGAIVAAIPVLAIGWYLLSPLFLNKTVVEDFPRAANAEIPNDMTAEAVEAVMLEAESGGSDSTEPMPEPEGASIEADPVALVTGQIMGADWFHKGTGTATIYQLDDGSRVLGFEDLDVTNGPDLHVLLSPVANPTSRDEVTTDGYIDLGSLKGNRGSQNYDVPHDFVIGDEISVVIYCVPFHVIFSTAALSPA